MHICHVGGALRGGPLTSISQLAKYQIGAGHRVTVIYSSIRDSLSELREALPVAVRLVPWRVGRDIAPAGDARSLIELFRIVRDLRPDIMHLHSSKAGFHGRLVARLLNLPNVYSPRGLSYLRDDVSSVKRRVYWFLEQGAALCGGPVVACSSGEYAALRGLRAERHLIPNGIDFSEPILSRQHAIDSAADHFTVVLSGRISPQRAPGRVAAIAAASPARWRFRWIGDGELRHVVEGGRVEILGWQDRKSTLGAMFDADVLLHPSRWEGMPNAILEAMALGIPVVASDVVGNRSLVRDGETGFLVGDDSGYLPALRRLADEPPLRRRMGQAGRARAQTEFDHAKLAADWDRLYRATIGTRGEFHPAEGVRVGSG
jgi:glycosyltransferase involved in cell wall biosynthesis